MSMGLCYQKGEWIFGRQEQWNSGCLLLFLISWWWKQDLDINNMLIKSFGSLEKGGINKNFEDLSEIWD